MGGGVAGLRLRRRRRRLRRRGRRAGATAVVAPYSCCFARLWVFPCCTQGLYKGNEKMQPLSDTHQHLIWVGESSPTLGRATEPTN